ncbi:hypothetical protein BpHYR1_006744 [Brachionus plicatilis]|uniref:Uncharacterized protein n=1 Tax=Brachionus plicatilis TaxID=10195 RepID=A0A3M7RL97_BRAPC|nr:hypothetical protein BpHYR1_006744 [Brachionus plicatilis]
MSASVSSSSSSSPLFDMVELEDDEAAATAAAANMNSSNVDSTTSFGHYFVECAHISGCERLHYLRVFEQVAGNGLDACVRKQSFQLQLCVVVDLGFNLEFNRSRLLFLSDGCAHKTNLVFFVVSLLRAAFVLLRFRGFSLFSFSISIVSQNKQLEKKCNFKIDNLPAIAH